MKTIPLSKGAVALVDDADYPRATAFKWFLGGHKGRRYAARSVTRGGGHTTLYLHRFLLEPPPGLEVDHRNGDGLDCRRDNLRVVTHKVNQANISARPTRNVDRLRGRYAVRLKVDGRTRRFGRFDTLEEALGMAETARLDVFGPV